MESPNATNEDDDPFFDAFDDFPFYDCIIIDQSDPSTSHSTLSESVTGKPSPEISSPASSFRRRSLARRGIPGKESKNSSSEAAVSLELSQIRNTKTSHRERRYRVSRDLRENEKGLEKSESSVGRVSSVRAPFSVSEQKNEESTVTAANDDGVGDSVDSAAELGEPSSSNLLVFVAGLVIKAIGFQINLLISFVTFPLWALYCSYMFVIDPFRTMRHGREYLSQKMLNLWSVISDSVSPFLYEWLNEHKSIWELVLRFGWGLFWSVYVCFILCGLLVSSLMISGFMMRYIVEEPIQIKETLNFDYTKNSPVAFVPVMSCAGVGCGVNCKEKFEVGKRLGWRIVQPNHKLRVSVSLTVPESEYNRNLGVFQVRVDFLSSNGRTLASSSHPCMLKFISEPIRLLLTFLKAAPLVAGFISESQILNLNFKGFTEGDVPSACLKVIIEQRAEYRTGAGIPEIYDASLIFESELPLFKRIIWYWKKTIYVWTSMMLFMMELLFTLVCCRPIIIPRARPRNGSASNSATQDSFPAQS